MKLGSKNDFLKNTLNEKVPLPIIAFFCGGFILFFA